MIIVVQVLDLDHATMITVHIEGVIGTFEHYFHRVTLVAVDVHVYHFLLNSFYLGHLNWIHYAGHPPCVWRRPIIAALAKQRSEQTLRSIALVLLLLLLDL